jgi:hypothetical protein
MFSRSQILAILAGGAGGVIAIAIMETFSARGPNRGDTWPRHLAATPGRDTWPRHLAATPGRDAGGDDAGA